MLQNMTRKCSIVGCCSNYKGRKDEQDRDNKATVFRFPVKDQERLTECLQRIPQQLDISGITDNMGVCEKHFYERFIKRDYSAKRPDGLLISVPRAFPILAVDAIPNL